MSGEPSRALTPRSFHPLQSERFLGGHQGSGQCRGLRCVLGGPSIACHCLLDGFPFLPYSPAHCASRKWRFLSGRQKLGQRTWPRPQKWSRKQGFQQISRPRSTLGHPTSNPCISNKKQTQHKKTKTTHQKQKKKEKEKNETMTPGSQLFHGTIIS